MRRSKGQSRGPGMGTRGGQHPAVLPDTSSSCTPEQNTIHVHFVFLKIYLQGEDLPSPSGQP